MNRTEHRYQADRRFEVKSGLVASVAYSGSTRRLVIELRAGRGLATYVYKDVDEAVYLQLFESQSPATTFAEVVRKGGYEYERLVNAH